MTLDELDGWLDLYGRAWERKDVDAFVACQGESGCAAVKAGMLSSAARRCRA